ncbi:MAG: molybdopterin-synthase adenylyltransferase MoeB [Halospina sp.]
MDSLTDRDLERYSRQILMPEFDVAGQQALADSRVLVVGAGGLGCPVVLYLAAAGVGHIEVVDDDHVELANLQRQIAFTEADIGRSKAQALAERAMALNPGVTVEPVEGRARQRWLSRAATRNHLVLDATDNFQTRFAVNQACVDASVPLVSGAAIRAEGQVAVFDSGQRGAPCYQCLYADVGEATLSCSEAGVIGPLVGMIGAAQAMEAIKLLAGVGESLTGRLLLLDAWRMQWREMRVRRDPACPICGD